MNWRIDANIKVENPKGRTLDLACGECDQVTRHHILTHVSSYWHGGPVGIQVWEQYYTVQCGGCRTVSFCHESSNSENIFEDPETGEEHLEQTRILYPSRIVGRKELEDVDALPEKVWGIYRETYAALCSGLVVLAGIGLRTLIESVCQEKNVRGADLKEKIDNLVKMDLATPSGAKILHRLRFMGNKAAHEVEAHSIEQLRTAVEVAEHLLKEVYTLPGKAW